MPLSLSMSKRVVTYEYHARACSMVCAPYAHSRRISTQHRAALHTGWILLKITMSDNNRISNCSDVSVRLRRLSFRNSYIIFQLEKWVLSFSNTCFAPIKNSTINRLKIIRLYNSFDVCISSKYPIGWFANWSRWNGKRGVTWRKIKRKKKKKMLFMRKHPLDVSLGFLRYVG